YDLVTGVQTCALPISLDVHPYGGDGNRLQVTFGDVAQLVDLLTIDELRAPGRYQLYPVRIGVIASIDQRGFELHARCRNTIDFRSEERRVGSGCDGRM